MIFIIFKCSNEHENSIASGLKFNHSEVAWCQTDFRNLSEYRILWTAIYAWDKRNIAALI